VAVSRGAREHDRSDLFISSGPGRGAMNAKSVLRDLLSPAGIAINGPNPWDVRVRNEAV